MSNDIFDSSVRTDGDRAGVFEYDGETGYFYLYETGRPDGQKVLDAIHVLSGKTDLTSDDIAIRWNETETKVGLLIRGVVRAVFDSVENVKFGGVYEVGRPPSISTHLWDYPNDADGDALSRIERRCDMSRPMDIDFVVAVPTDADGRRVADVVRTKGYAARVEHDDVADAWSCYCTKRIVPSYAAVVAAQAELDQLSAPFGGYCDGWGTFGNVAGTE